MLRSVHHRSDTIVIVRDVPEQFGSYLVYEQIGVGGMATVHRAERVGAAGFRKPLALKRMLPGLANDADFVKSFVREARLVSNLRHANIAQTFDFGKVEDTYFIAMELVRGPTLKQIMHQCSSAAGAIPVAVALAILEQVCAALEYAHGLVDDRGRPLGIVHRDVTPTNIIVSSSGVTKLIDFGLAKISVLDQRTQAGTVKGKLGYMAPEYTFGAPIDARADLFALGVVAHELLTGRPLFGAYNDFETLERLREMPIQPPSRWNPQVVPELDHIIMTGAHRDPTQRWQNASAFRAALLGFIKEQGLLITNTQIAEWVMWAFSQQPRNDDSALARLFDDLAAPSDSVPNIVRKLENTPPPGLPIPRAASKLTPVTPITEPYGSNAKKRRALPIVLLGLAATVAAAAAYYFT